MTSRDARRVLVVDDTESKRYVIASWLRRAGFEVLEESTGLGALARAHDASPDLVVLDVHLPDIDGLEVCRRLRADPATNAVPVMHISGVAIEAEDRSVGLEQGADAYLAEPIDPRELVATAESLLRYYEARRSAERLAARLGRLTVETLRINQALSLPRLLAATATAASGLFGEPALALALGSDGDWVACAQRSRGGEHAGADGVGAEPVRLPGEVSRPLLGGLTAATEVRAAPGSPWSAALTATFGASSGPASSAAADPVGPDDGWPWTLVPVHGAHGALVAAVAVRTPHVRTIDDTLMLRHLARSVSVALENLRAYVEEHHLALTLQRSLVPEGLADLPGLSVQARYLASSDVAEIGGDFFDAFELEDGTAVVAIGDVQGHSLAAAMIMAELRYSIRAYAHDGHGPQAVVERLNRRLMREHPEYTATMCLIMIDPDRRSARFVNAGHLPPLLLRVGEPVRFVPEHGALLGVPVPIVPASPLDLVPGDRLLLVTDGLVERRDLNLDVGLGALARRVASARGGDLREVADLVMREFSSGGEDDMALVALEVLRG